MSFSDFSTSAVAAIKPLNASETPLITPTAAPNAKTRAADASIDFWNSLAELVILPSG